jgi:hypothetical protein
MLHLMQRFLFMPDADEILQAHAASAAGISDPELATQAAASFTGTTR